MPNLAFSRSGHCFVLVQNQKTATDEEWGRWVAFVGKGGRASGEHIRVLILSKGGSPTPKQRRLIHDLMPKMGGGTFTAIVLSSFIGRTVVAAMSLFNDKVRAFAPDRLSDALDYLAIPTPLRPELESVIAGLHETLSLPFNASEPRSVSS